MNRRTLRLAGAALTVSTLAGLTFVQFPTVSAAVGQRTSSVRYVCEGITGDTAGTQGVFLQGYVPRSSAYLMSDLAQIIPNFSKTPEVFVDLTSQITPSNLNTTPTPTEVAPLGTITGNFGFNLALPPSIVSGGAVIGLTKVTVTKATFGISASNATPATIAGEFPPTEVLFTSPSVSKSVSGSVVANNSVGSLVNFTPSVAELSIQLNKTYGNWNIKTISLRCTPDMVILASTPIRSTVGPTTAAPTTAAPTTAAPTTAAPTTAAPTTAAPTTAAPTTAAPTTAAPTTAAPTTAAPTTAAPTTAAPTTAAPTTVPPVNGNDAVAVSITGGVNYSNSGLVGGKGYTVRNDSAGVTTVSGTGTLPGSNGGTATVSVTLNRFLFWSFGTIAVDDPGAGVRKLSAPILFAPIPKRFGSSTVLTANGFTTVNNRLLPYKIVATVSDDPSPRDAGY